MTDIGALGAHLQASSGCEPEPVDIEAMITNKAGVFPIWSAK
jgi:hypothetical protein